MIQLSVASDASRLTWMVGSATLTIVVSSRAMNMPAMRTMSAFQAERGTVGSELMRLTSVIDHDPSGCRKSGTQSLLDHVSGRLPTLTAALRHAQRHSSR